MPILPSKILCLPDGEGVIYPQFFDQVAGDRYLKILLQEIDWQQEWIRMYGQRLPLPRLTAWYGDSGTDYTYSGITVTPKPWTETLLTIRSKIVSVVAAQFNSVLLNQYRDGRDSLAWHSDDEPELGAQPIIASVSFGATRRFSLKHKYRKDLKPIHFDLDHGSLLLMQGDTQANWLHQVPKTTQSVGFRINLTFREIVYVQGCCH
jgi:alkylated DNA repair dioxygenase AlkB